jgi:hypothetical protein
MLFDFLSCLWPLISGIVPALLGPETWLNTIVALNTGPLGVALPALIGWL